MNTKRNWFFSVVIVFLSLNCYAEVEVGSMPHLTQLINSGEVVVSAHSAMALVPTLMSAFPVVSSVQNVANCNGFLQVNCHRWDQSNSEWDCECQILFCGSGWSNGNCPK